MSTVLEKERTELAVEEKAASIVSLGSSLDRKQASFWLDIDRRIFEDDEYHIPSQKVGEVGEETEFFVLYDGDVAVGRATASVNRKWIEEKGDNLGFISDFVISPDHKHLAELLIDRCLDALREKGVEGAVVKSHGFPALAAQELDHDVPPFCLPGNPPWYIDLFESKGFVKYKEWASFHLTLPSSIPKEEIDRGKRSVKSLDAKVGPLKMRSRRQVNEFHDVQDIILENHFAYTPKRFITEDDPRLKHILFVVLCKLVKNRIHVLQDTSGRVVGCVSFAPNFNVVLRPLMKKKGKLPLSGLPRFLISLRRAKRAEIGVMGTTREMRSKGLVKLMHQGLRLMVSSGYKEFDTGPILVENTVVMKMVDYLQNRYGLSGQRTTYYTLVHRF